MTGLRVPLRFSAGKGGECAYGANDSRNPLFSFVPVYPQSAMLTVTCNLPGRRPQLPVKKATLEASWRAARELCAREWELWLATMTGLTVDVEVRVDPACKFYPEGGQL